MGQLRMNTYSDVALNAVLVAVLLDALILRTQLMTRGIFWLTYGLILPFQLLTNWWLTSKSVVMYSSTQIMGKQLAFIHDELQFECPPDHAETLRSALELSSLTAGESYNLRVPIAAESKVGQTWADVH